MQASDEFVPLPMPEAPWSERVCIIVAAARRDGAEVSWVAGSDDEWVGELERASLRQALSDAIPRVDGEVREVRTVGPHLAVVVDGLDAPCVLRQTRAVLRRVLGPLPHGSRAVLTRHVRGEPGLTVELCELREGE
jgi:hypothetical protein